MAGWQAGCMDFSLASEAEVELVNRPAGRWVACCLESETWPKCYSVLLFCDDSCFFSSTPLSHPPIGQAHPHLFLEIACMPGKVYLGKEDPGCAQRWLPEMDGDDEGGGPEWQKRRRRKEPLELFANRPRSTVDRGQHGHRSCGSSRGIGRHRG